MVPVQQTVPVVLRAALHRQPFTEAKLQFAWRVAVGPAIARATQVRARTDRALVVVVASPQWRTQLLECRPALLSRVNTLLEPHTITTIDVIDASAR